MKIILIGYMGSGKSTVGNQLSKILNYNFKDLDTEIEQKEEKTISNIFSEKGEIYFRKKEGDILKEVVNTNHELVLATGGGTPCYGDAMRFLSESEQVVTVYLKASLPVLTDRLFLEKEQRPLISHLPNKEELTDFIRKHLFERSHVYSQADVTVTVDNKETSEIVEEIIAKLF